MNRNQDYIPVVEHLVAMARRGFEMLSDESRTEVVRFIESQQHPSGGFSDRGGAADTYYSLFGAILSSAFKQESFLQKLRSFSEISAKKYRSPADEFALLLIRKIVGNKKSVSFFKILKILFRRGHDPSLYRIFLFLLVFDATFGWKRPVVFFASLATRFFRPSADSPCSIFAALLVARFYAGCSTGKIAAKVFSFYEDGKGFKSFPEATRSDMLSTAVALFALKYSGNDLRSIAPGCLGFIQENYEAGAFLSGDGDLTRDVEYTFYGLLALGTLV
jgi:hypothetical protein